MQLADVELSVFSVGKLLGCPFGFPKIIVESLPYGCTRMFAEDSELMIALHWDYLLASGHIRQCDNRIP